MQKEIIQTQIEPQKSTYSMTLREGLIFLESDTTRLVFTSFADILDLRQGVDEAILKAQNYGALVFEAPTIEEVQNEAI